MFAIHARIAFLPVVKGGFGNPKVAAYDLGFFASFVILEGMYDLAFGESGCFNRLNKVKVFPFLISPKFGEGYRTTVPFRERVFDPRRIVSLIGFPGR
jgi:hypothetical protein